MARGVDPGWVRAAIAVGAMFVAAAAGAATFNGRVVRNETRIERLEEDLRQLKGEVHDIWLKVVKDANGEAACSVSAGAR